MICISIAAQSREFALVDMFNAGPQCNLLEVRLDRFYREPDIGELLASKTRPVIMTCRRAEDGGEWQGNEADRLARLHKCFELKADYVEVELDVADQFPASPHSKKIVAYTNMMETPEDLGAIYADCVSKKPDVVKLATPTRTPEDAWPLVQVLAKATAPTVVMGLGEAGVMLTLLARKIKAPWAYAALEKGMESYYGQPSVRELLEILHYADLDKNTRFVGVTGFQEEQHVRVALLNAAFKQINQPQRCLPIGVGEVPLFRKIMDAVKMTSVVVDKANRNALRPIVSKLEPYAELAENADFLAPQGETWHGYQMQTRAALTLLEAALQAKNPGGKALEGRTVIVVGSDGVSKPIIKHVQQRGGKAIMAHFSVESAQMIADELKCKLIDVDSVAKTPCDAVVVCEDFALEGEAIAKGTVLLDLTKPVKQTKLIRHAHARGAMVVLPRQILVEQTVKTVKALTSQDVAREPLLQLVMAMDEDA